MSAPTTPTTSRGHRNREYWAGWEAHALGRPLKAGAGEFFAEGWMDRKRQKRPSLHWAAPGTDTKMLVRLADRISI